jgi:hypothetical protein
MDEGGEALVLHRRASTNMLTGHQAQRHHRRKRCTAEAKARARARKKWLREGACCAARREWTVSAAHCASARGLTAEETISALPRGVQAWTLAEAPSDKKRDGGFNERGGGRCAGPILSLSVHAEDGLGHPHRRARRHTLAPTHGHTHTLTHPHHGFKSSPFSVAKASHLEFFCCLHWDFTEARDGKGGCSAFPSTHARSTRLNGREKWELGLIVRP